MKHWGIRARLTFSYAVLFALLLAIAGGALYRSAAARLKADTNTSLDHSCSGLWGYFEFPDGQPILAYDREDHDILFFLRSAARYYQLYDSEDGRLLMEAEDSALLHLSRGPQDVLRLRQHPGFDEVLAPGGVPFRFRSMEFRSPARHPFLLRVGRSLMEEESDERELLRLLLLLMPAGTAVALVAGWVMAGRALKPVQQLRLAADEIGISQLDRRLPLRGTNDELDLLAGTFNQAFTRLEKSVAEMKQFTASISHELRTPLACLQAEAERALQNRELSDRCRQIFANQLEEFHRLDSLLRRLLTLARAEAGEIRIVAEEFDVAEFLVSTAEQIKFVADSRGVNLQLNCAGPVAVLGDRHWLQSAVLNLLDNALKFTPAGGRVLLESKAQGGLAIIEFSDTGIGIAEQDLPHIFERFFRANASRSREVEGVGLGLAIAKWIIEAHHGSIEVQSRVGAGSRFTVCLPLAQGAVLRAQAR